MAIPGNHRQIVKPCALRSDSYIALKNKFATAIPNSSEVSPESPSATAPFGIAISGGVVGSATVNNFGKQDPLPRKIEQIKGVAAVGILKTAGPSIPIDITMVSADEEIVYFARQIAGIFSEAKWSVSLNSTEMLGISYESPSGYLVYRGGGLVCYHKPEPSDNAKLVVKALQASGYPCREIGSLYANDISIFVGTRFSSN